jgi:predicted N-acetyltransferase YhbS
MRVNEGVKVREPKILINKLSQFFICTELFVEEKFKALKLGSQLIKLLLTVLKLSGFSSVSLDLMLTYL